METKVNRMLDIYSVNVVEWKDMDKRKFYSIGPAMFVGLRGILYPFGLIKTRLFMQRRTDMYKGTLDAFRQVVRYEGFRGLYKGFLASNFGLFSGQIYITIYELTRSSMDGYSTAVRSFVGGLLGSLVAQTLTVPVDIVSQHLMVQGQVGTANVGDVKKRVKLKGALTITRDIVRNEGIGGLYRGYPVSLMTYAPGSAIWWSSYMAISDTVLNSTMLEFLPRPLMFISSGMCAAVVSSTSTNVMDLVRTRYQVGVHGCECSETVLKLTLPDCQRVQSRVPL